MTVESYLSKLKNVAVIGSTGAIGSAFLHRFQSIPTIQHIYCFSRSPQNYSDSRIRHGLFNYEDEQTIEHCAATIKDPLDLIIITTGMLHDGDVTPEKSIRSYNQQNAQLYYLINTIGPSLVMKYFWPHLNKSQLSVMAALCARIGSIEDNKLGGWHSYRASKAALCMMIKNISIEVQRRNANSICIGLHPGTVNSQLSQPFQKHIKPETIQQPEESVQQLIQTISQLTVEDSGFQFAYDGKKIPG